MEILTKWADVPSFRTKDGSLIRELIHPKKQGNRCQSLAEATVEPGQRTQLHKHHTTEELYFITSGEGRMTLATEQFDDFVKTVRVFAHPAVVADLSRLDDCHQWLLEAIERTD